MSGGENAADGKTAAPLFATTHWSVVVNAGHRSSPDAQAALEELCRVYWYPLYAYLRRFGYQPADAQDSIQSFFTYLLEGNYVRVADPNKGRFRSFLLGFLKRFLSDEYDKARAQKRGGGKVLVPLDDQLAEGRYALELAEAMTPEKSYERHWALTILEQALARLHHEYQGAGNGDLFNRLEGFAAGEQNLPSYAELAQGLRLSENAVKSAIFRLRRRYRELIREEIAQTVAHPNEVDEEIRYLIGVLSN